MSNPFHTDPFRILFRFAGLGAILYGLYIWRFVGTSGNNAFALYATAPSWAFALPLILGGSLQFVGCCLYRRWIAGAGVFLNWWIFLLECAEPDILPAVALGCRTPGGDL